MRDARAGLLFQGIGLLFMVIDIRVGIDLLPDLVGVLLVFLSLFPLSAESRAFEIAHWLVGIYGLVLLVAHVPNVPDAIGWVLTVLNLVTTWLLLTGLSDYAGARGAERLVRRIAWLRWLVIGGVIVAPFVPEPSLVIPVVVVVIGSTFVWIWTVLQCRALPMSPHRYDEGVSSFLD